MHRHPLAAAFVAFLPVAALPAQSTLHVPAQYATIQAAIDKARDGEQILVGPGTYREPIDFKGRAVRVIAARGPRDHDQPIGRRAVEHQGLPAVEHVAVAIAARARLDVVGGPARALFEGEVVTPALRIDGFRFTSATDF